MKLLRDWIRTGIVRCPDCGRDFEATVFDPPVRRLRVAQVVTAGPVEANPCANHARNAAVTSCQRCGLLICALCDMNVGSGSYCPSCFDRMRAEGSDPAMATKTRDYRAMARVSAVAAVVMSFAFFGPVFGIMSIVYLSKARKQRVARGEPAWSPGLVVILIFDLLSIIGGMGMIVVMVLAMSGALK